VGFVVHKIALGKIFSDYCNFPLPIRIPPPAAQSLIILSPPLHSLDADSVGKQTKKKDRRTVCSTENLPSARLRKDSSKTREGRLHDGRGWMQRAVRYPSTLRRSTPQKHYFSASGTHLLEAE
jgi:hypothetical protein